MSCAKSNLVRDAFRSGRSHLKLPVHDPSNSAGTTLTMEQAAKRLRHRDGGHTALGRKEELGFGNQHNLVALTKSLQGVKPMASTLVEARRFAQEI
jgi:hypothetical protein